MLPYNFPIEHLFPSLLALFLTYAHCIFQNQLFLLLEGFVLLKTDAVL